MPVSFRLLAIAVVALSTLASASFAAQTLRAAPDGNVGFNVSTSAVTRLSVRNDRIRRIVLDDSAFEMSNDAETGDVFFRVTRPTTESENGYIITEGGHTIGFTFQPTSQVVEPVLITLTGVTSQAATAAPVAGLAAASTGGGGYVDDVASSMTGIIRQVARTHVSGRAVPNRRNGTVDRTASGPGWAAQVIIATAGASGRLVREQDFYGAGVQAVWVLQNSLPAHGRTFVVVVRKR